MLNFLTTATEAAPQGGGMLAMLLPLGLTFLIMWVLMIRPENKRKKEAEAMRNAVKRGDRIVTIGGIMGVVVDVKEEKVVLESGADQVRIELAKWALSTNETADAAAKEQAKKDAEAKAKAKAVKKAEK